MLDEGTEQVRREWYSRVNNRLLDNRGGREQLPAVKQTTQHLIWACVGYKNYD